MCPTKVKSTKLLNKLLPSPDPGPGLSCRYVLCKSKSLAITSRVELKIQWFWLPGDPCHRGRREGAERWTSSRSRCQEVTYYAIWLIM